MQQVQGRTGGLERLAQAVGRPELRLVGAVDGEEGGGAAEADDAVLLRPRTVRRLVHGLRRLLAQLLLQRARWRPVCRKLPCNLSAWCRTKLGSQLSPHAKCLPTILGRSIAPSICMSYKTVPNRNRWTECKYGVANTIYYSLLKT